MWMLMICEPAPSPLGAWEAEYKLQRMKRFAKKCSGLARYLKKARTLLGLWAALIAGYGSLKTTNLPRF